MSAKISDLAVVGTKNVGHGVSIGPFAVIADDVSIGNDVRIHPHVVIESGVTIGDGVEIFPGAYIGKEPKGAGSLARKPTFERRVVIGPNSSIGPHAVVYYDVEIGNNTLLGDGASIREKCRIGSYCIVARYVTINYNTTIGDRTKIMDLSHITGNCTIGNDVFVSVLVGTTNDNSMGRMHYDEARVLGPTVHDGVAIGVGASVLPNVEIGEATVIGSGSVVSKNIGPDKLVLSVPAKVLNRYKRPSKDEG